MGFNTIHSLGSRPMLISFTFYRNRDNRIHIKTLRQMVDHLNQYENEDIYFLSDIRYDEMYINNIHRMSYNPTTSFYSKFKNIKYTSTIRSSVSNITTRIIDFN